MNTSAVTSVGPGLFNPGAAAVNVAGLARFNELTLFGAPAVVSLDLSNPSDPASGTGILGQIGPEFPGYNLQTSFGPDTGSGGPFGGSHITPYFPTTMGDMTWAFGQSLGSSTFTAVLCAWTETCRPKTPIAGFSLELVA